MANLFKNVVGLPVEAVNLVWLEPADGHWTIVRKGRMKEGERERKKKKKKCVCV